MSSDGLTTIESSGSMSLLADGNNYLLQPNDGPAVELSYNGAPVVAGEFARMAAGRRSLRRRRRAAMRWPGRFRAPISIRFGSPTAAATDLSSAFDWASGSSAQLESYEASFNDDLNGDGTIGVPPPPSATVIEVVRIDEPAGGWGQLFSSAERRAGG